jgi:hypothetical protein
MPKKLTQEDYETALEIYRHGLKHIDPHDDNPDELFESKELSAEKQVIKIEAFERLSNEAKELIEVILYSPAEILKLISTPKRHKITLNAINKHLTNVFRSKFIAQEIIKEIKQWLRQL